MYWQVLAFGSRDGGDNSLAIFHVAGVALEHDFYDVAVEVLRTHRVVGSVHLTLAETLATDLEHCVRRSLRREHRGADPFQETVAHVRVRYASARCQGRVELGDREQRNVGIVQRRVVLDEGVIPNGQNQGLVTVRLQ